MPRKDGLLLVAALAALMWVVEIADLVVGDIDRHGIQPREPEGLVGVVTSPFLHGGFGHLIGNTVPFLVLGLVIALGGALRIALVTAVVAAVAGIGTWLTAADGTVHIGASGIDFGYATYLVARGLYSRRALHLAAAVLVVLVWGSTLLLGLVPTPGVSWQAHLFGAIGGVVAARMVHRGPSRRLTAAAPGTAVVR
jgi:membrane associated rhomboid family serine protease